MLIPLCRRRTDRPPLAPAAPATGLSAGRCQAVLDALDVGVLVCDEHARLVHANAAGEQALAQSALLCLVERRLSTPQHDQQAPLLQAIRAATCGRHQLLKLQFGALRLSLSVQPLAGVATPKGWAWPCCASCTTSPAPSSACSPACCKASA